MLERVLPAPPGRVLDVGGGTGVHARWLAAAGFAVTLVDLMPGHVEQAAGIDLLGPLYHLTEASDRSAALREAVRVARGLLDFGAHGGLDEKTDLHRPEELHAELVGAGLRDARARARTIAR